MDGLQPPFNWALYAPENLVIFTNYCKSMAEYNSVMNVRLYLICSSLSADELMSDCGLFFGSIHRTLDHILYGDMSWLLRFEGKEESVPELDKQLYESFDELKEARKIWDKKILDWSSDVTEKWLSEDFSYTSKVDGKIRTRNAWLLVAHMFNHETHHREAKSGRPSRT